MGAESRFEYPCLVDVRKACPPECKLHSKSARLLMQLAHDASQTPEEYLGMLRLGTPAMIEVLNQETVRTLKEAMRLEECQNIEGGKID